MATGSAPVFLRDTNGRRFSIDPSEVDAAVETGEFRLETAEETKAKELEAKFGDSEGTAAAAGAARGLTFGLSDQLLTKTGMVEPETLRGLREVNPTASTFGEVGGSILGLAVPGGLVAKGALVGGRAVFGAGAAARVAAGTAQGLFEGGLLGAGHAVSEAALGDTELRGEQVLASVAQGALLGGGVGLGVGLVGAGIRAAGKKLNPFAAGKEAEAAEKARAMAEAAHAKKEASALGAYRSKVQEASRDIEVLQARQAYSPEAEAAKRSALGSSEVRAVNDQVLINKAISAPQRAAEMLGKKAEYEALKEGADAAITEGAESILSGAEFKNQLLTRVKRYGPPTAVSAAGAIGIALGGPVGAAVAMGGALAGAGMRPAIRSWLNFATKYPAVPKAFWGAVKRITEEAPEKLGPYSSILSSAIAGGPKETFVTHAALALADPGYREAMASLGFKDETPEESELAIRRASSLGDLDAVATREEVHADSAVGGFLGLSKPGAYASGLPLGSGRKARVENFNERLAHLSRLSSAGPKAAEVLGLGPDFADAAPATYAQAVAAMGRAVNFLLEKAPKSPTPETMPALSSGWEPTDVQLASFERYLRAVESPRSVLEDMQRGTVTREAVEAIRAVYPKFAEHIQKRLTERMAGVQERLSYRQRLQLSTLFGVPMDRALSPHVVAALQAKPEAKPSGPVGASGPSPLLTDAQRLESRGVAR